MNDDENEIVCVRVLFSSFAPFLYLQKNKKILIKTLLLDFNDRMRQKSEKRREILS